MLPPTTQDLPLSDVLIVDDDPMQTSVLSDIMRDEELNTAACGSASEAVELYKQRQFGVVIVDLRLPDDGGLPLIERLSALDGHARFIIHTGYGSLESAKHALDARAFAYVEKSGDAGPLLVAVHRALRERAEEMERCQQEAATRMVQSIVESAQDAIIMADDSGNIVLWNQAATRIFGYTEQDAMGRNAHELLAPPQLAARYREAFPRFQQTGQGNAIGKTVQLDALRKGGEQFPVELSLSTVHCSGRWHAIAVVRDITERCERENELLRIRYAIDNATEGIGVADMENNVFYHNHAAERLLGYTIEELASIGGPPALFCDSDVSDEVFERLHRGEPWTGEVEMRTHSGQVLPVFLRASPILNSNKKLVGYTGFLTDITARKRVEETLLRQNALLQAINQVFEKERSA